MRLDEKIVEALRLAPGVKVDLAKLGTAALPGGTSRAGKDLLAALRSADGDDQLHAFTAELESAQELLYASASHAVLVVLQGMDASGKDGTIKHVMSGVNPQGCDVTSFKTPSSEELSHDFLWRAVKALPERGKIGIFNRSYYEDVLVVRVHRELAEEQRRLGGYDFYEPMWTERFEAINAFERHLVRSGTQVVKIFLNLSEAEQKRRLLKRLDDTRKYWKFSMADIEERALWSDYLVAYQEALSATSTQWAPWYVIPADHKYLMRTLTAGVIVSAVDALRLAPPAVSEAKLAEIAQAKALLATT
jgi:PPK2 family polyphosphate:nucleotide phosphotransferase